MTPDHSHSGPRVGRPIAWVETVIETHCNEPNKELDTLMAFAVPDLPYDYDALEPHIDEATMRIHHDKHHQAYVDKANGALEGTESADRDVEDVLRNLSSIPGDAQAPVRNNAGGPINPSLVWPLPS